MLRFTMIMSALAAFAVIGANSPHHKGSLLTAEQASSFWGSACGGSGYGSNGDSCDGRPGNWTCGNVNYFLLDNNGTKTVTSKSCGTSCTNNSNQPTTCAGG